MAEEIVSEGGMSVTFQVYTAWGPAADHPLSPDYGFQIKIKVSGKWKLACAARVACRLASTHTTSNPMQGDLLFKKFDVGPGSNNEPLYTSEYQ